MTVEMALFFVLEEHPLPTCFETTSEMFHDLKNVCLYNTAYVLLNQFARSSGSWRFYCHVITNAMYIRGSSRCRVQLKRDGTR